MSTRLILCACSPAALHSVTKEFTRQGFHSFEISINKRGQLVLSGLQGFETKKLRKPLPKSKSL